MITRLIFASNFLCVDPGLTGDPGFFLATNYVAGLFKEWGLAPGGDGGSYFQYFPHPYTEVKEGGYFKLYIPVGDDWIAKEYPYPDHYMAGGTSDSGELKGLDLAYVGYGVTAPELNYDDYGKIDVRGKIVVCEQGIPYQGKDSLLQKQWTPYQYHSKKMKNAIAHGAAGMLYNSVTGNPNPGWNKGFVYAGISDSVVVDIFAGTGRNRKATKENISKALKPNSFEIHKRADLKAVTEFHPEGKGCNIIGVLPGSDPGLAPQVLMIGAHIDHIGMMPALMPGAFDNASGTVIVMGVAKALTQSGYKPKRTLVFVLFGGEETGLIGSEFLASHPVFPNERIKAMINIDCVGKGYGLGAAVAQKYGSLFNFMEEANQTYVKRPFKTVVGRNEITTRPRTDDANFFMKGIPTISMLSFGAVGPMPYHHPGDVMELMNFDLVQDAVKLLSEAMMQMGDVPRLEASPR